MISELLQKYKNTDARTLKMRMNTIYMMFLRCCSILITLISAPIMLTHVDRAEYGVLMTLSKLGKYDGYRTWQRSSKQTVRLPCKQ